MSVTINISGLPGVRQMLDSINMDELCLDIASSLKAGIRKRIHEEGRASDGSPIGTYSLGYMKIRTGNYSDGARYKRGAKSGSFKEKKSQAKAEAGVFSRGTRKGQPRPVYNRKGDNKVILSLTRQMENDMRDTHPIKINGGYGIGFGNDFSAQKAEWNNERYGKAIYALTEQEIQDVRNIVDNYIGGVEK